MLLCIMGFGALSDRLLQAGKSRFVARGSIAIIGMIIFSIGLLFAIRSEVLEVNIAWLAVCLSGMGITTGMSWAAAADIGRNFSGTVSGWMNLWGNVGAMLSPLLAGILADLIGWTWTLQSLLVLVVIAIFMWFFVKPDRALVAEEDKY